MKNLKAILVINVVLFVVFFTVQEYINSIVEVMTPTVKEREGIEFPEVSEDCHEPSDEQMKEMAKGNPDAFNIHWSKK